MYRWPGKLLPSSSLFCILLLILCAAFINDDQFFIFMNDYQLSLVKFAGIYVILAVSLNLTNGFTGLFSLGHPAFMAVGGYVASILTYAAGRKAMLLPELPLWIVSQEWPLFPALLVGGVLASLSSLLVGIPVLRLRGHYLAVATLGYIIIVQVLIRNLETITRGALGLNGIPYLTDIKWVVFWVILTLFVCWRVVHSPVGRAMKSIREDEIAAITLGIPLTRIRVFTLALGAFFAGIAGGLWAHLVTVITPDTFSILLAFNLVVMVVVGGAGSITGSVLAAIILSLVTEALRPMETAIGWYGLSQIILALGLLIVVLFRPQGIMGTKEIRIRKFQQKVDREGIKVNTPRQRRTP
jgi:branched-chain amino acid transport system permease protein